MKFNDFSQTVRELWAIHNALRTLGFPSEDIFLVPDAVVDIDGKMEASAGICLIQGPLDFILAVPRPMPPEHVIDEWLKLAAGMGSFGQAEMMAFYETSFVRNNSVAFLHALTAKGFVFVTPNMGMELN